MLDKTEQRITDLEKQVKAQQEEIETLKRQVQRLLHPYAPTQTHNVVNLANG